MKNILFKKRLYIFFIHLIFSFFLLIFAFLLIKFIWYPEPLGSAMGVSYIYYILMVVDLILGPLLTFIVYKSNKKKLFFDMIIIISIQLSAYFFGLYTMHQGKPAWLVFVKDDIEIVSPVNIREEYRKDLDDNFKVKFYEPPKWISADYGIEPEKRQKLIDDEMFDGVSIVTRPETYVFLETKSKEISKVLNPIDELNNYNNEEIVKEKLTKYPNADGWLPIKSPEKDMVAIFDENSKPIAILNLKPWED